MHGKKQIPIPNQKDNLLNTCTPASNEKVNTLEISKPQPAKETKPGKVKSTSEKPTPVAAPEAPIDVGRLDFRIGRIVEIAKHPDADSLYVEKVDCGGPNLRTVVSGLVNHIPIGEMQNRLVVLLCNLKPVKVYFYDLKLFFKSQTPHVITFYYF